MDQNLFGRHREIQFLGSIPTGGKMNPQGQNRNLNSVGKFPIQHGLTPLKQIWLHDCRFSALPPEQRSNFPYRHFPAFVCRRMKLAGTYMTVPENFIQGLSRL